MSSPKNEIIETEEKSIVVEQTPMQFIAQAIQQPDFNVENLEKLMDLQERYEDRQAIRAFNAALANFQDEVPRINRDKKGGHNIMYAPLDTIMKTIQPFLSKHGLSVRFSTKFFENAQYIEAICTVSHKDGHAEQSTITVPVDSKMVANSSQKMGSANSYAKRYALANALNLAFTEDDDDAAGLYETVTEDQATEIEDLIKETKSDRAAFLKWAGVSSVDDIPQKHYKSAVSTLRRKLG